MKIQQQKYHRKLLREILISRQVSNDLTLLSAIIFFSGELEIFLYMQVQYFKIKMKCFNQSRCNFSCSNSDYNTCEVILLIVGNP